MDEMLFFYWDILVGVLRSMWSVLPLIIAAVAAVFAYLSARATRLAAQGKMFSELLLRYSSEEMRISLMKMGSFRITRERNEREFFKRIRGVVKNRMSEEGIKARDEFGVDACRRRVSHFFRMILELYENKRVIDRAFLQHICSFSGFELWYIVVEHLEKEINPDYDRDSFTRLLWLSARDDADKLQKLRPTYARG